MKVRVLRPLAGLGRKMFKNVSFGEVCLITVVAFAFLFIVMVSRPFYAISSMNKAIATAKAPETTTWYVLEEPTKVVTGIFKFKIAYGPKEPMVEAFGYGHNWVFGQQPFPRPLVGYEVKLTSSVASQGGMHAPVRFIQLVK